MDNPGKTIGNVSEFTLLLAIKDGLTNTVRQALSANADKIVAGFERMKSVHDARWIFLPDGKHVMLVTVFDDSWDKYIDDFAEHAGPEIDQLGGLLENWPGVHSGQQFKDYIRSAQIPADIFWSAYPTAKVSQVRHGLRAADALQTLIDVAAEDPSTGS